MFIGGLPHEWHEDHVKNLLLQFGRLKSFHLGTAHSSEHAVKDKEDQCSKGYAFCEYTDDAEVENAIRNLNGARFGHRTITAKRS